MNDAEVQSQINQMVQFIHQEAKEKAAEIKLKADEEFNIEKLRMCEAEKQKIRAEYERKEKHVEVQKRIKQSNDVRLARLKTLKARDDAMQELLKLAAAKLPSLKTGSGYPKLLENLIVEALKQLCDQKVEVKPVAGEEAATKKALGAATAAYTAWATSEMGAEWAAGISITMDTSGSLANGIAGVQVTGMGGKITLTNTLQSRLMLAYECYLPQLRGALFD
jgi:V-type H+-transporting ATPase subunit E